MATPAHRLIQDQNLNILYNGAISEGYAGAVKPAKKGGLGGRKALNDISNSRKPNVPQPTKKENSTNVISIEKDPHAGKRKAGNAPEKGKIGGRKALGDLTNSVKPVLRIGGKLDTVAENIPSSMVEEGFLHNHQECIKAQMKSVDMDYFLKSVGLKIDAPVLLSAKRELQPSSMKLESIVKPFEMEEMPEEQLFGYEAPRCRKSEFPGYSSPACRSPKSPKLPYMNWGDDNFSDLILIETPKLLNR